VNEVYNASGKSTAAKFINAHDSMAAGLDRLKPWFHVKIKLF